MPSYHDTAQRTILPVRPPHKTTLYPRFSYEREQWREKHQVAIMQSICSRLPSPHKSLILLVEDHHDTITVMRMILEREGYRVHTAESIASARQCIIARNYDIIICDILLRDGTGWELLQELKPSHMFKSIALSGLAMKEDAEMSLSVGFDRHINKPFITTHLLATIAELLIEQEEEYATIAKHWLLTLPCKMMMGATLGMPLCIHMQ
jgi:CheY-like chemotaxis protein